MFSNTKSCILTSVMCSVFCFIRVAVSDSSVRCMPELGREGMVILYEKKDEYRLESWDNLSQSINPEKSVFVNVSHEKTAEDLMACSSGVNLQASKVALVDLVLDWYDQKNRVFPNLAVLKLSALSPKNQGTMFIKVTDAKGAGNCLMINISSTTDFMGCYWCDHFFRADGTLQDVRLEVSMNQVYNRFSMRISNWSDYKFSEISVSEHHLCLLEPFVYMDVTLANRTVVTIKTQLCTAPQVMYTVTKVFRWSLEVVWTKTFTRDPRIAFSFEDSYGGAEFIYFADVSVPGEASARHLNLVVLVSMLVIVFAIILVFLEVYLRRKKPKIKFVFSRHPRHKHYLKSVNTLIKVLEECSKIQVVGSNRETEHTTCNNAMDFEAALLPTYEDSDPNLDFIVIIPMPDEEESVVVHKTLQTCNKNKVILLRLPSATEYKVENGKGKTRRQQAVVCFQLMDEMKEFIKYTAGFRCLPFLTAMALPTYSNSYLDLRGVSNDVLKINFDSGYIPTDKPRTAVYMPRKSSVDLDTLEL